MGAAAAVRHFLIGPPLRARQVAKEQITPIEGLPALSLDALTSVAYGPEAIIVVLATAGLAALHLVLPISIAIVVLLAVLVFSYRQVIEAYPGGGGTYAVCRANFPPGVSLLAAAALVVDYTLTVAVSIAAGVASLTSAFPGLSPATVPICLGILALVTGLNLRGLGDTARAFLLPTMVFIVGLLVVIAIGLIHPLALHAARQGRPLVPTQGLEAVGVLLVLKAFSAGCSALTGVEAIANGVPLFKQPRVVRAKRTELLLGGILGVMLLGLAVLANRWHIGPRSGETVLSQVIAIAVGRDWAYYVMSLTITVVLMLAANTSFGGLPVLTSRLAGDNYLPHLFSLRDERQVFAVGIWTLAGLAGVLLVAVRGQTLTLIPLYAIGVFTAFTLSQSGLVKHWWQTRPRRWQYRAVLNGAGAATTAVATVIFLVTKFTAGAWVVVLAVPALIALFARTHAYYARFGRAIGLDTIPARPHAKPTMVVVPVIAVDRLTQRAVAEALSISPRVVAVHVVVEDTGRDADRDRELDRQWGRWNPGVPLKILRTEYASVARPIVAFIDELHEQHDEQIVVLIPVALPDRLRYRFLHNHLEIALTAALKTRPDVVVASVPMPLRDS
ncbi:APC family permease [Dactylosporangium sp. NPDC048998]|uniref:APC family permease n=1 Tax=Dactylosporangium sp. NPDC048998 TaxID=3363976 RepID=UPI003721F5E8